MNVKLLGMSIASGDVHVGRVSWHFSLGILAQLLRMVEPVALFGACIWISVIANGCLFILTLVVTRLFVWQYEMYVEMGMLTKRTIVLGIACYKRNRAGLVLRRVQ